MMDRLLGIVGLTTCAIVLSGLATTGCQAEHGDLAASPAAMSAGYTGRGYDVRRLDDSQVEELARSLSRDESRIILQKGTEPSFTGDLLENKADGVYVCRLCGLPLFSSQGKFESGTGWPSFYAPFDPEHIATESDATLGMVRTEILCRRCDGHLGHVFEDGPEPTGLRYCVNSASLDFYGVDDELPSSSRPIETAYFAGGCFWGVEDRYQQVPGVLEAVSGYQGGTVPNPTYRQVCSGQSGHAESVRVVFDPSKVSYEQLLEWFFRFHDPTQRDRQGPDYGTQYRSAVFAANDRQLTAARHFVEQQQRSGRYGAKPIVTQIAPAAVFYEAETYHQDYHLKHGGSCPLPD